MVFCLAAGAVDTIYSNTHFHTAGNFVFRRIEFSTFRFAAASISCFLLSIFLRIVVTAASIAIAIKPSPKNDKNMHMNRAFLIGTMSPNPVVVNVLKQNQILSKKLT